MKNFVTNTNWIHFIGIGGVTMAPLAIKLAQLGYKVTGSDTELYEPIKSLLENSKLQLFTNYSYSNLVDDNKLPALVVCGSGISLKNKEYLFATKQNIKISNFPELINNHIANDNLILVIGTYAKTTTVASIAHILNHFGYKSSYMFGGIAKDGTSSIEFKSDDRQFSVVEGDEYIISRANPVSKFFAFRPKYVLVTGIDWDHVDIFPTKNDYVQNFHKYLASLDFDVTVFANYDDEDVKQACQNIKAQVVPFDKNIIEQLESKYNTKLKVIGQFNKDNLYTALNVVLSIVGDGFDIKKALESYEGIKRRLEIKYQTSSHIVIDDFASSPPKVKASLASIRQEYKDAKIVTIFEPNVGNRTKESLDNYTYSIFENSDTVILPPFASIIKSTKYPIDNVTLSSKLNENDNVSIAVEQEDLITELLKEESPDKKTIYAFLSSHGMEENIIKLTNELKNCN